MQINKAALSARAACRLLYGSMIAKALGNDAVECRTTLAFERHVTTRYRQRQSPAIHVRPPARRHPPICHPDGQDHRSRPESTFKTMERVVGPNTLIASLCNGITSEQKDCRTLWLGAYRSWYRRGMGRRVPNGALTLPMRGDRFGAARAPSPQNCYRHRRALHAAASPIPSRATLRTACGPNSCSTTASTRPAWPTAGLTEAPRSRPGAASLLFSAMRERLRSPTPRALS